MNTLVITFNLQVPAGGMLAVRTEPKVNTARRVHLRDADGMPAELLFATACQHVGCDCAMRLGKN